MIEDMGILVVCFVMVVYLGPSTIYRTYWASRISGIYEIYYFFGWFYSI